MNHTNAKTQNAQIWLSHSKNLYVRMESGQMNGKQFILVSVVNVEESKNRRN